jgi:hypothetical protein
LEYARVERNSLLNVSHYGFIFIHVDGSVERTFFFASDFFLEGREDIGCGEGDRGFNSESNDMRFNTGVWSGREKLSPECFPLPIYMCTYIWRCEIFFLFESTSFLQNKTDIGCGEEDREFNSESNDIIFNTRVCAGKEKRSPQSFPLPIHYVQIYMTVWKKFFFGRIFFVKIKQISDVVRKIENSILNQTI